jgi:hypothetical protein
MFFKVPYIKYRLSGGELYIFKKEAPAASVEIPYHKTEFKSSSGSFYACKRNRGLYASNCYQQLLAHTIARGNCVAW